MKAHKIIKESGIPLDFSLLKKDNELSGEKE